jgi:Raf kinase inhibitor-like YbhB/YbcL family protein
VTRIAAAAFASLVGVLSLVACSSDGRTLRPAGPNQTLSIVTTTVAPSTTAATNAGALAVTAPWKDGGTIDAQYTCKGTDISPAISWSGVPAGTQELALTLTDIDASNFIHWVIGGIDPASSGIAAGKVPTGAVQAANGFGDAKYGGPCPPDGNHTYLLRLYALGAHSGIANGMAGAAAIDALEANQLESTSISGVFG